MRAILYVEIVGYHLPVVEGADQNEKYIELIKEFDVAATLAVGMTVQLPCILIADPNHERYQKMLQEASVPVSGTFRVTHVTYDVKRELYTLGTDFGHSDLRSIQEADLLAAMLIVGYGFVTNDCPVSEI